MKAIIFRHMAFSATAILSGVVANQLVPDAHSDGIGVVMVLGYMFSGMIFGLVMLFRGEYIDFEGKATPASHAVNWFLIFPTLCVIPVMPFIMFMVSIMAPFFWFGDWLNKTHKRGFNSFWYKRSRKNK